MHPAPTLPIHPAVCIKDGVAVHPEIMVPLVGVHDELEQQARVMRKAAAAVKARTGECV